MIGDEKYNQEKAIRDGVQQQLESAPDLTKEEREKGDQFLAMVNAILDLHAFPGTSFADIPQEKYQEKFNKAKDMLKSLADPGSQDTLEKFGWKVR